MKRTRENLLVTVVAAVLAMAMLTACNGENTSPATTTPVAQEPTKTPEVTKAPEPTEAPDNTVEVEEKATPTEAAKQDLIIDGYNITEFNNRDADVPSFIKGLSYDEPKLIVAKDDEDLYSQDILAIINFDDHLVIPKDKDVVYYLYVVHDAYNVNGQNVSISPFVIESVLGFRMDGVGEEEKQVDIGIEYKEKEYNTDVIKGTTYSFYVKKGEPVDSDTTTTTTSAGVESEEKSDDLIIDGYNISKMNRDGVYVFEFVNDLTYEESKVIAMKGAPGTDDVMEILGIISVNDHFTEPKGVEIRYVPYSPDVIYDILKNDNVGFEKIDFKVHDQIIPFFLIDAVAEEGGKDVCVNFDLIHAGGKLENFQFYVTRE